MLNGQTLLEKAKAAPVSKSARKGISVDRLDLWLAWLRGEITGTQASVALGCSAQNVAGVCATDIKRAVQTGAIHIEKASS